jgi:hypothetical protein
MRQLSLGIPHQHHCAHCERERAVYFMKKYGGGFVSALAVAYQRADLDNRRKIEEAFPHLFEEYGKFPVDGENAS